LLAKLKKKEAENITKKPKNTRWRTNFLAIVRYELLWNIRNKKFLAVLILALALATLTLVLPVILNHVNNLPTESNPDYVITTGVGVGSFGFFLFALVSVMNSISGEFESGSMLPLLTKPVSRTTVYLGKIFAAFLTILGAYILLIIYLTTGGYIIYGPQNNLQLIFITLLGSIVSTLVWMAIVLAAGSVSKSSMLAALLGLGVFLGLNIASGILSVFSNQAWILTYAPGNGASGAIGAIQNNQTFTEGGGISTGTDGIAANLITYILHPTQNVTFYKTEITGARAITRVPLYTEPLSLVVTRSIVVAAVYIFAFNLIAWYALKRAQVAE
jgi:ABC-type transport system involved in multi-copper enzyme maturation permease subunit